MHKSGEPRHDIDPTYEEMSYTEKGPAYYPGECSHGAKGESIQSSMPGAGKNNLSPPNASGMGGAMEGSGLPPANGISLVIAGNRGNPMPPGPVDVDVRPAMPATGEAALPPGPSCGKHDVGNPGQLPPGVPVGGHGSPPRGGGSAGRGPGSGGGQLPPGVSV
jgi:hypothetical protein